MAMQAQQTKIASLSPVGRSEGSDNGAGTETSSELLFCLVSEELLSNVPDATAAAVFEGVIMSKETPVWVGLEGAVFGSF